MKIKNKNFFLVIFFLVGTLYSQNDTIVKELKSISLKTKKISKTKLVGLKSVTISTEQITKNPANATNLLRFNSPISFRDYGNGSVSVARFRGTSATNTLVLWNGLPVNAIGNGQTDFNALPVNTLDEIVVRSGGAGATHGSSAIGGVVELNDKLEYKKQQNFHLFSSYGSFNTTSNFVKMIFSDKKWTSKLAASYNSSVNDYTIIDKRFRDTSGNLRKNENGSYKNYSLNLSLGYRFSKNNLLSFFTTKYYGDRLFSFGLPNPEGRSERNEDLNQRNLLKWEASISTKLKQEFNLAYLTQEYRYYNDKDAIRFDFGQSENIHADYTLKYRVSRNLKAAAGVVYDYISGETDIFGETDKIVPEKRKSLVGKTKLIYKPNQLLLFDFSFRQEKNSSFKVPTSWSLGVEQNTFKKIQLNANISRNYRVPTFNELYWPKVGNLDLVPEKSLQGEFGVSYKVNNLTFSSTFFYIHIDDKIVWIPQGNSNVWRPLNIESAFHKGLEVFTDFNHEFSKQHKIKVSTNYTLAIAKDLAKGTFLPFSPKHVWNFNIDYFHKKIHTYVQNLYQSKVFTNTLNIDINALASLDFVNFGAIYTLLKSSKKELYIGCKVNNVFNTVYYFSNLRPNPGTNFNFNINYKF